MASKHRSLAGKSESDVWVTAHEQKSLSLERIAIRVVSLRILDTKASQLDGST
jgi:hypothetical protein